MAELELVGFKLGDENYVVDIMKVKEIIRFVDITNIPESLDFVEGVINLRGIIIPVINLKVRLGLKYADDELSKKNRKIIIIEHKDKLIGMTVDMITKVIKLDSNQIAPTPELVTNIDKKHIKGIGKYEDDNLLIILDIEKILDETEIEEMIRE
ncbi:MAG: chemotaxis protein CheW [Candidatus Muiribacterium halophilum]|uniref:Chemotaxis protein CheW n=1 Tax=Muiribacterium halophilum TaxID=2053465 RepID=A0A2N5ZLN5_MUIH1|nr:MAG: chemotaxis protein CheW [Candidatus Muirbacterium halophilum]